MKLLAALMLVFCQVAAAQQLLWIDLSGEWRAIDADLPEFAAMDFDDRSWETVHLPAGPALSTQRHTRPGWWLRRRIELPAGIDTARLTLSLGTIQPVYEVYVNGHRIAASGDIRSLARTQIPRPQTWWIPEGLVSPGQPVQIAIRLMRGVFAPPMWRLEDKGPYLLTYEYLAPVSAGRSQLSEAAVEHSPSLIFGAIFLVLGILGLAGWASERSRTELLWFSMVTFARAVNCLHTWSCLSADAMPFNGAGVAVVASVTHPLIYTLFGEFVLTALALNRPWPRLFLWLCFALALRVVFLGQDYRMDFYYGNAGASLIALSAVLWTWWRTRGTRVSLENHLFRFTLMLSAAVPADQWLRGAFLGSRRLAELRIHGYTLLWEDTFWLAVSATIFAILIRRMALDRREQRRLANELEAARAVQQLLLKQSALRQPDLAIDAVYIPAQEVGGDFYYVLDGELVLVGDVSGKGLKAAMLVALVIGVLLHETNHRRPSELLEVLNRSLTGHVEGGFITCCCIRFGPDGSMRIANAGHPVPYLNGTEAALTPGLPLGITRDATYDEAELTLAPGSAVTLISDGVPEAANAQRELLGFERTREMSTQEPSCLAEAARLWGQTDDITVVSVRRSA